MNTRACSTRYEISEELLNAITDRTERFVSNVRRGKLGSRVGGSFSTTAACEVVELMHFIVTLFRDEDESRDSVSNRLLREGNTAEAVATWQVRELMRVISFAGEWVLRAQFGTLLLMNIKRRVLSFIRAVAVACMDTPQRLNELAKRRLCETIDHREYDDGSASNMARVQPGRLHQQQQQLQLTGTFFGSALMSPTSTFSSDERRQPSCSLRENISLRYVLSSAAIDSFMDSDPTAERIAHEVDDILAIGIPGRHNLRRAKGRRDVGDTARSVEFPVRIAEFYDKLLVRIAEFQGEIEGMCDELCSRASRQLHHTDTVITIGCSNTTRRYLLRALKDGVNFKVIILEGAPSPLYLTQKFAGELRAMGADAQVFPDSSAFAVMGTCTKVLIGVESVLANGGLLAPIGTHPLCIAARHFAVPVLVATTTLKMSPYYPRNAHCTSLVKISRTRAQEIPWNTYGSPNDVLPKSYDDNIEDIDSFVVHSPVTEYVPPELVTLYSTNESEYTPSQILRIIRENYHPED